MAEVTPYVVAGQRRTGDQPFEVTSPFDGSLVARVGTPTERDLEEAIAAAARTFEDESRLLPTHARAEALLHISRRIGERVEEVAELIAREGGKPLRWARVEAGRATSTFRWAAETIRAMDGEALRLDTDPALGSRLGLVRRFA
ncbi:MAG TPA: aldehyde dehydrogenase family protein, partial [Actinomycetota bacterium]|nr:aldehyde dehydrogenase family protein [Actinomycetota bacterium]